jgi:hypothetical protein
MEMNASGQFSECNGSFLSLQKNVKLLFYNFPEKLQD